MKKISTICAVLVSSLAIAQGPGFPIKKAQMTNKYSTSDESHQPAAQSSGNRAVFYTNDFSTPSSWTLTNTSSPAQDWVIGSTFPTGLAGQGFGPTFTSTSGGNFAIVNSDLAGASASQNCNMTNTAPINCSAESTVAINFDNYHRIFRETHKIFVSNDGVNFTEFNVNTSYGSLNGNYVTSPNGENVSLNISCVAANQATVYVRFNYVGTYDWFWCVDDVTLSDAPGDDLKLSNTYYFNETLDIIFGTPLDYPIVPANQIDNLVIRSTLDNLGANAAANAQFDVAITNSASTNVFTGSSTAATINACDSARVDSVIWSHTAVNETYTIATTADFTNVANDPTTNNTGSATVRVVANSGPGVQWARDNGTENGSFYDLDANPYIMGNVFYVYNDVTVYSIDAAFMGGTNATDPGVAASVTLFEMDPAATATADVFIPIFSGSTNGIDYAITAPMIGNATTTVWNKFPVNPSAPETGILLEGGKQYMAAVEHYGGTDYLSLALSGGTPAGDASVWLYGDGGSGVDWYYATSKLKIRLGLDQQASFLGVDDELEITNLNLGQNVPNPTNDNTKINYSLTESANVTFEVIDITGKVIYTEVMGNKGAGAYSINVNTADFAAGIYYYTMTAGADKITKKMMVTK
jgi:hypothetical protein